MKSKLISIAAGISLLIFTPTVVRAGWLNSTQARSNSLGSLDRDLGESNTSIRTIRSSSIKVNGSLDNLEDDLDPTNVSTDNLANEPNNSNSYLENLESIDDRSEDKNISTETQTSDLPQGVQRIREDNSHEIETVFEDNSAEYKYSTTVEENAEHNLDRQGM
ncbi:MAG: hypothetical protein ACRC2R_05440 [Xenococcaceae cyanobacterium]